MLIGAHISSAGGISNAPARAKEIGCNCVQIFSASPRIWKRPPINEAETCKFVEQKKQNDIKKSVIHAIYLVNLASENPESLLKSRSVIEFDLNIDSLTEGSGVVVHLGSHQGRGFEAVKEQLVEQLKIILDKTPINSTFLIENSAGQNGKIASELQEIRWLLDSVGSPRLGWCMDTCHAYANGFELRNKETSTQKNIFTEIDNLGLWDSLKVIHVNDSRDPFDSGRDRHANIGDGEIGNEVLASFLSHPKIKKLPLILEVPGLDGNGPDAENVVRLTQLCQ